MSQVGLLSTVANCWAAVSAPGAVRGYVTAVCTVMPLASRERRRPLLPEVQGVMLVMETTVSLPAAGKRRAPMQVRGRRVTFERTHPAGGDSCI